MRAPHAGSLMLAIAMVSVGDMSAQVRGARITGTVLAARDGRPLADVTVALSGVGVETRTDASGSFTLTGVPAGEVQLRFVAAGGETWAHRTRVRPGGVRRLSIVLDPAADPGTPTVVRAEFAARRWGLAGFYARRTYGYARFFTAAELTAQGDSSLRVFLANSGVAVEGCVFGDCGPVMTIGGSRCVAQVLVNGSSTYGDLDRLTLAEVGAIEVYRADALVPLRLQAQIYGANTDAGLFWSITRSCGSIVIWSRDWRPRSES